MTLQTAKNLEKRGLSSDSLTLSFHHAFDKAETVSPSIVQRFWDEFGKARKALRGEAA